MRTLLVEDDVVTQALMHALLTRRGHEVICHADGSEAWSAFEKETFPLVVADWNLPGLNGMELCQRIRSSRSGADAYVLIITGRSSDVDVRAMLSAGASDYAVKPVTAATLEVRLRIAEFRMAESQERRRAQDEARRMRTVADLGRRALEGLSEQVLLDHVVRTVAETLEVELTAMLEREKGDAALKIRASRGVDPALVDALRFPEGPHSQSGYTLQGHGPVLVSDYSEEKRFKPVAVLVERYGIRSGITVLIEGADGPFGVLGAWSRRPRVFTPDDASYLQSIANIVAMALKRRAAEDQFLQAQKMEAIGMLAGGVAHDFNNLLSAINGYSELLLLGQPEDSPIRAELQEIHDAGERAAGLTRQLLTFSRRQVFQPQNLDCNEVVAQLEKLLRRLIGENIELATDLHDAPATVYADRGQLEQVVMNLAVNARDAMPEGGRLRLATSLHTVADGSLRRRPEVPAGTYVELRVEDTGCGMSPDVISHIFEPFFTTKEQDRGTGLGLSTVYGVVRQSNGHIHVESEPGRGTCFEILIPYAGTEGPAPEQPRRSAMEKGSETILLVEDDDHVRRLASLVLRANGYSLLEAGDGEQAIERLSRHEGPVDLLLTDLVMPRMSGKTLADRVARPGMKVLFMSGYSNEMIGQAGRIPADVRLLQKPFTPSVLSREVRRVLDE